MKLQHICLLGALTSVLFLTNCGCSNSASDLQKIKEYEYQRGLATGKAMQVRQQYHQEKRKQEAVYKLGNRVVPPLPLKSRYYTIPIPAHTSSDGINIAAHTKNIEVIQP